MTPSHVPDARIQAFLDEEDPTAAAKERHHLTTCAECGERLRQYQRLYARIRATQGFDPPPHLAERLLGAMLAMPRPARPWLEWVSAALILLAGVASGVVVLAYPAWHGVLLARADDSALLLSRWAVQAHEALRGSPPLVAALVALTTAAALDSWLTWTRSARSRVIGARSELRP